MCGLKYVCVNLCENTGISQLHLFYDRELTSGSKLRVASSHRLLNPARMLIVSRCCPQSQT